jgi:FixJ family two-component response regulator
VLRQNADTDVPGCNADDQGEDDRSLTHRTPKPDRSTRHRLSDRVAANTVAAFATAKAFLNSEQLLETSCLITDVQMPGMSGIELQALLKSNGHSIPVIVITGFPDERVRERAMQLGAVSFLTKPFADAALIECLERAHRSG